VFTENFQSIHENYIAFPVDLEYNKFEE